MKSDFKPSTEQQGWLATAGLEALAREFPEDIAVALESAARMRAALPELADPRAEPWPPMRMRDLQCID